MRIGRPPRKRTSLGEKKLHTARIRAARDNPNWTEIPDDLVERDRGHLLVSADTDHVYTLERGVVFEPGTAHLIATHAPFSFVIRDGQVLVLQQQPGTWSDRVRRRAHRRPVTA